MSKCLVSGGAGFISSHLIDKLDKEGHEVVILDNLSTGKLSNINKKMNGFIEGDIRDREVVLEALNIIGKIDVVFHLAAMTSIDKSWNEPEEMTDINVTGTVNLLNLAKKADVKRFVYVSSAAVYGKESEEPLPIHESTVCIPKSPYASSKLAGEYFCKNFRSETFHPYIVRPYNVYGPRQDIKNPYASVIPKFFDAVLKGTSPIIHGNGFQTRDFIYVKDLAEILYTVGMSDKLTGKDNQSMIINAGSGQACSIILLWNLIVEITGSIIEPEFGEPVPGKVRHSLANTERVLNLLGKDFKFKSLHEGLIEMKNSF